MFVYLLKFTLHKKNDRKRKEIRIKEKRYNRATIPESDHSRHWLLFRMYNKYITRYTSDSSRKLLITDIVKVRDYISRLEEKTHHPDYKLLLNLVNKSDFKMALVVSDSIESDLLKNEKMKLYFAV